MLEPAVYDSRLGLLFWFILICLSFTTIGAVGCFWYITVMFEEIKDILEGDEEWNKK